MLGIARMYVATFDFYFCGCGIEVFIFKFADCAAVHGIGEFAAELLDIELVGAKTDFFIRIEADAYLAVFNLGVSLQPCDSVYDFRYAGFVVGSEQCVAIGYNQSC